VTGRRIEPSHPAPQERQCETDPYDNVERCGVNQGFGGGERHSGVTFWPFDAPTHSALPRERQRRLLDAVLSPAIFSGLDPPFVMVVAIGSKPSGR